MNPYLYRPVMPPRGSEMPLYFSDVAPLFNKAVVEVSRTIQAPVEVAILTGLAAMAAAVQGGHDVMTSYGKALPISVWVAGFAESGERKDALTGYFFRGFDPLREQLRQQYEVAHRDWRARHTIWKRKNKNIEKRIDGKLSSGEPLDEEEALLGELLAQEPMEPVDCMLILEDSTPAAILEQLNKSGGCIAIVSAEGAAFLNGRTSDNLAMLDTAWSGGPLRNGRVTSGSVDIPDVRVTSMILVQPSIMDEYMARRGAKARGIGFLARFLVCYPSSTQGYRPFSSGIQPTEAREEFSKRIQDVAGASLAVARNLMRKRSIVTLSKQAESLWDEISRQIEVELRPGGRFEFARDHASKLSENILRTAAVCHIFEGAEGEISEGIMQLAINICFYCSGEFLRLFCGPAQEVQDVDILKFWLLGRLNAGQRYMERNFVQRCGPGALRSNKRINRALDGMIDLGLIREFYLDRARCIDINCAAPFDLVQAQLQVSRPVYSSARVKTDISPVCDDLRSV